LIFLRNVSYDNYLLRDKVIMIDPSIPNAMAAI